MLFNEEPTTTNTPQPAVEPAYGVDFMRGFMLMSLRYLGPSSFQYR